MTTVGEAPDSGAPQPPHHEITLPEGSHAKERIERYAQSIEASKGLNTAITNAFPWNDPSRITPVDPDHPDVGLETEMNIGGGWSYRIQWTPFKDFPSKGLQAALEADNFLEAIGGLANYTKEHDEFELSMLEHGSFKLHLVNVNLDMLFEEASLEYTGTVADESPQYVATRGVPTGGVANDDFVLAAEEIDRISQDVSYTFAG